MCFEFFSVQAFIYVFLLCFKMSAYQINKISLDLVSVITHNYCPTCRESGSNADLESTADNLFTSPPHSQPLPFSSLSIKTPANTVPPTPGTALQQKIESNLEKSLCNTLNLHLQQRMGGLSRYLC